MKNLGMVIVCCGLVACTTPHMVVPTEIASGTEVVPATERSAMSGALADESFKLGQYAIADVDRDWNSSASGNALGFKSERTEGGYSYKVKGNGTTRVGGCAVERADKSVGLGGGFSMESTFQKLGCTCKADGASEGNRLVISAGNDSKFAGEMTTPAGNYRVTAIYETEGMISNGLPSGYRVDGDAPRGAVEVLKPGRVWFARGLEESERGDLACLYVGLMLYEPPRDK